MGLGPNATFHLTKHMLRDDYRAGGVVGYKCTEGNTRDCVRVPDTTQYGNAEQMMPRSHERACMRFVETGKEVCASMYVLQIDGKAKRLGKGYGFERVLDCTEQCRQFLWPDDPSTYSLCSVTELDEGSPDYGKDVWVTPRRDRLFGSAQQCFKFEANFDWHELKKKSG